MNYADSPAPSASGLYVRAAKFPGLNATDEPASLFVRLDVSNLPHEQRCDCLASWLASLAAFIADKLDLVMKQDRISSP